jgi:GNAT superfamily N-acetyltransferase
MTIQSPVIKWHDYELYSYTEDDIEEILSVINPLLQDSRVSVRDFFTWKHRRNPLLTRPIGIVARHSGRMAGFHGFTPAACKLGDKTFMTLQQCDTVVHPDHRGKGLFSAMLTTGVRMYSDEYKLAVATTANPGSVAGCLRSGWQPLVPRYYLRHFSLLRLAKNRFSGTERTMVRPGVFGDIEVALTPCIADISRVGLADCFSENKICQHKTPEFLAWKLANPKVDYSYFYHFAGSLIDAYVILRSSGTRAHIFDYAQLKGSSGVPELVSFILRHTGFDSLSLVDTGTPVTLRSFLRKKQFYTFNRLQKMKDRMVYGIPIVLKPTVDSGAEADWLVDGLDVRNITSWQMTEICFD